MNTIELKKEIINKISAIDDAKLLNAIVTILNYNKHDSYIDLTESQEKELLLAREEGKRGEYLSQSEMDKKVQKWLKEK